MQAGTDGRFFLNGVGWGAPCLHSFADYSFLGGQGLQRDCFV